MNTASHISRRTFLRSAALASLSPAGCATLSGPHHGYVDAHVHVWTPDTHRYPLARGFSKKKDMVPLSFTPEQLFAHSRPAGVDRVVLIQMNFYEFDNRYMLDAISQHPRAFRGVAIIDEHKSDACDTMKALAKQGVRGFRLYADRKNVAAWVYSPAMKRMWKCAADEGLAMCLLADPDALPAIEQMCMSFPKTRVVIDHFARIGMKGPVQDSQLARLCSLARFPNTYVKTSAFYALGRKKAPYTDLGPMLQKLRDAFGASRLMWGSDCPFQVQEGHTYSNSIALIRERLHFLTPADRESMLTKTAERLFFS